MYMNYNPHPKEKKIGDCVVRTWSLALDKSWIDTYSELCTTGMALLDMPGSKAVLNEMCKRHGFTWVSYGKIERGKKRPTVADVASMVPKGVQVIVSVASHLVYVEDGHWWDSWDSGKESTYGYWKRNREK